MVQSTIIFISGNINSVSHRFRVVQVAETLLKANISTRIFDSNEIIDPIAINSCHAVIIFRAGWSEKLNNVIHYCKEHRIPVLFDIDDLIFDTKILEKGYWAFYNELSDPDQKFWIQKVQGYQMTLEKCDAAIVSTPYLAEAAKKFCGQSYILPNMLDDSLLNAANNAKKSPKPSFADGQIRIGFASGTPTHKNDFDIAVESLVRILREQKQVVLTIVGALHVDDYPKLYEFEERIEKRPLVSMEDLMSEIYRFDINIAPLELNNPFCESKSALRCMLASAVRTPTIVSPTQPLLEAVDNGSCGKIAKNSQEWYDAFNLLIHDIHLRNKLGAAAEQYVTEKYGPIKSKEQVISVYSNFVTQNKFKERSGLSNIWRQLLEKYWK